MTLSPGKGRDVVTAESEPIWPTVKYLILSSGCDAGIEFVFYVRRREGVGGEGELRIFVRLRGPILWRIGMLCRGMLTSTVRLWWEFFFEKGGREDV